MACLWKRLETRHAFGKEALGICEMMAMRSSEGGCAMSLLQVMGVFLEDLDLRDDVVLSSDSSRLGLCLRSYLLLILMFRFVLMRKSEI